MTTRWIRRKKQRSTSFQYTVDGAKPVRDRRTLERIRTLRIPPAWRDVHIATSARAPLQAWGYDARGRRQYRYHERAVARGELRKYHRMCRLAKELPRIRRILRGDSRGTPWRRDTVAALVLRLIGETFCRVGGERGLRENGTFGIATVRKRHVTDHRAAIEIEYRGKARKPQRQVVTHPELVRLLRRQLRSPGARLFRVLEAGKWSDLTARDVNSYLRERIGGGFLAKDFRTWGGCLRAAIVLAELGAPRSATEARRNVALAMRIVGSELGNTAAICRKSYVHPMVIARYEAGETITLPARPAGGTTAHSGEERALIRFLDRHFPDRRRRAREDGE